METSDTQIFELPGSAVTKAYWQLAGAVALILFSLANFFVALRVKVTMINLQMTCTVPMLMAVFLIAAAIRTLRMAAPIASSSVLMMCRMHPW